MCRLFNEPMRGETLQPSGMLYRVCGASITKGRSICLPIQPLQSALDDFVVDAVGQRIAGFLGKNGRATLGQLVGKDLGAITHDPRPERRRLKASLEGIAARLDSAIDLAASASSKEYPCVRSTPNRVAIARTTGAFEQ